jgi:hypothetical protein
LSRQSLVALDVLGREVGSELDDHFAGLEFDDERVASRCRGRFCGLGSERGRGGNDHGGKAH